MKKILVMIIALTMTICFASCGEETAEDSANNETTEAKATINMDDQKIDGMGNSSISGFWSFFSAKSISYVPDMDTYLSLSESETPNSFRQSLHNVPSGKVHDLKNEHL